MNEIFYLYIFKKYKERNIKKEIREINKEREE